MQCLNVSRCNEVILKIVKRRTRLLYTLRDIKAEFLS